MDLGIKGKRALVLGGSKGLGRGIAEALAAEGVVVALTGRDQATAVRSAAQIADSAMGLALDLGSLMPSIRFSTGLQPISGTSTFSC